MSLFFFFIRRDRPLSSFFLLCFMVCGGYIFSLYLVLPRPGHHARRRRRDGAGALPTKFRARGESPLSALGPAMIDWVQYCGRIYTAPFHGMHLVIRVRCVLLQQSWGSQ